MNEHENWNQVVEIVFGSFVLSWWVSRSNKRPACTRNRAFAFDWKQLPSFWAATIATSFLCCQSSCSLKCMWHIKHLEMGEPQADQIFGRFQWLQWPGLQQRKPVIWFSLPFLKQGLSMMQGTVNCQLLNATNNSEWIDTQTRTFDQKHKSILAFLPQKWQTQMLNSSANIWVQSHHSCRKVICHLTNKN